MGFWNIVQEAFMLACVFIGGIFAVSVVLGLLGVLLCWVFFLLDYPMALMFWIFEKMLPPFSQKEERPQRCAPEPPPPPPLITRGNKGISEEYER